MQTTRFSYEQMIIRLKQAEAGMSTKDICGSERFIQPAF
jgi:hypothetical protein